MVWGSAGVGSGGVVGAVSAGAAGIAGRIPSSAGLDERAFISLACRSRTLLVNLFAIISNTSMNIFVNIVFNRFMNI